MATVTVSGLVIDETGRKDSRDWKAFSPVYREGSDGEVVTMRQQQVRVVAGMFSAKLDPGVCVLENPDGQRYTVTVPDEDVDLWNLIATAVAFPPNTEADALASAVTAYLEDNPPTADWDGLTSKPAVIAAGEDQAAARSAIGAASTTAVATAQATADAATVASPKVAAAWAETTDKQAAPTRPALVAIGDSITASFFGSSAWNGSSGSRVSRYAADNFLTAAMVYSRWPCTAFATGVVGQSADAGLARFDTDVTPIRPQVVLTEYGSNDAALNRTAVATFADLQAMWAKAWKFGAKVIAVTCPPRNEFTTAQMKEALKFNTMLRNYAATNPQDFALVDSWAVLADPATGQWRSGYSDDGTHPNTLGCWVFGKAFEAALDRFFPTPATNLAMSNINDDNLLANPLMITTGGPISSNNGLSGSCAGGGWFAQSNGGTDANTTSALSLVARADGFGYWQQINTTVIPNTTVCAQLAQVVTTGFAAGDIVQACVEFETDSAGWTNGILDMQLWCYSSGFATAYSYTGSFYSSGVVATRPESGVLQTPPIVIPTGTVNLYPLISVGGLGTVRLGRAAIRKLAA